MKSKYIGDPTFRKFIGDKSTYYVPTDILNAADNVLIDVRDPDSRGFGGSTFDIKTTLGTIDEVKGPWHGSVPYDVCNVSDLHYSKTIIVANPKRIPYDEWKEINRTHDKSSIEVQFQVTGDVIYEEKQVVLGAFMRGDRIAQQLADLRDEVLFVHVETSGGAHSHECVPGGKLHPMAHRRSKPSNSNDLSTDQNLVVEF